MYLLLICELEVEDKVIRNYTPPKASFASIVLQQYTSKQRQKNLTNSYVLCSCLMVMWATPQDCLSSLMVMWVTPQDCLRISQCRKAVHTSKTKFWTCSYSMGYLCYLMKVQDCHKTSRAAARHARCSYGYSKSSHSHISPANASRLQHDYHAMTVCFIARLLQECY